MTMDPRYRIRPGRSDEADLLRAVERAAGSRFRAVGLDAAADGEPTAAAILAARAASGRLVVATGRDDGPVGFAIWRELDGRAYLEEVSVHPSHAGHGIGASLVAAVELQARAAGFRALVLTTFADVPWNAPWYARLGFEALPSDQIGPELARAHDDMLAALGSDARRICMVRPLARDGAA